MHGRSMKNHSFTSPCDVSQVNTFDEEYASPTGLKQQHDDPIEEEDGLRLFYKDLGLDYEHLERMRFMCHDYNVKWSILNSGVDIIDRPSGASHSDVSSAIPQQTD